MHSAREPPTPAKPGSAGSSRGIVNAGSLGPCMCENKEGNASDFLSVFSVFLFCITPRLLSLGLQKKSKLNQAQLIAMFNEVLSGLDAFFCREMITIIIAVHMKQGRYILSPGGNPFCIFRILSRLCFF